MMFKKLMHLKYMSVVHVQTVTYLSHFRLYVSEITIFEYKGANIYFGLRTRRKNICMSVVGKFGYKNFIMLKKKFLPEEEIDMTSFKISTTGNSRRFQ